MALGWKNQYSRYKDFFLNFYGSYRKRAEVKMFIEILLSISVSAFFVFFALRPTIVTILELVKTIQEKEKTVETMEQKLDNLELARNIYDQNADSIALLNRVLPEVPEPEVLSRQLQGIAGQNSLEVSSLTIEELTLHGNSVPQTSDDVSALPPKANPITFKLNLKTSSFSFIPSLLTNLENLRTPIRLDNFLISAAETEGVLDFVLAIGGRGTYLSKEGQ